MKIIHLTHVPVPTAAKRAAETLAAGSLVIYPTDTFYGIGADATNAAAVKKLQLIKGQTSNRPFLSIFHSVDAISQYAEMNDTAHMLAERFLPGPLSLILTAKPHAPAEMTFNGTIGVRIPNNEFCLAFAQAFGKPFVTTNANRRGREISRTIEGVLTQFTHDARLIGIAVDDGEHSTHVPLTVVSCVGDTPQVLREGAISRAELGI